MFSGLRHARGDGDGSGVVSDPDGKFLLLSTPTLKSRLLSIAGGELFERLVDDNFEHTELTSACYMRQILQGMEYVHKQNIVHLDLKPENIVCVDTTGTQIKIIDFGLASKLGELTEIV